jgi:hypothetical protein
VKLNLDEATTWLELAACVTRLPATGLLTRLREGDEDLADAILAVLESEMKPSQRLDAVRDFLVQHSLGETWDPTTDVGTHAWSPDTSPFQVPQRFLDAWFPQTIAHPHEPPVERLMRIRQFYDSIDLEPELQNSTRMFGNRNIGDARRTNLQVPGQFTFDDTPILITSWWITTVGWPNAEKFFARCWVTVIVGDRPEMMTPALELWHRRQAVLIPVPPRQNFSVVFDFSHITDEIRPAYAPPLYVFVEGWGQRKAP